MGGFGLGVSLHLNRAAPRFASTAVVGTTRALKFNVAANSQYIPVIGA